MFPPEVWEIIVQYCDIKTLCALMYIHDSVGESRRKLNSIHHNLKDIHKQYVNVFTIKDQYVNVFTIKDQYYTIDIKDIQPIKVLIKEWGIMKRQRSQVMLQYIVFICKMWPKICIDDCSYWRIMLRPNYGTSQIDIVSMFWGCEEIISNVLCDAQTTCLYLRTNVRNSSIANLLVECLQTFLQLFCDQFNIFLMQE